MQMRLQIVCCRTLCVFTLLQVLLVRLTNWILYRRPCCRVAQAQLRHRLYSRQSSLRPRWSLQMPLLYYHHVKTTIRCRLSFASRTVIGGPCRWKGRTSDSFVKPRETGTTTRPIRHVKWSAAIHRYWWIATGLRTICSAFLHLHRCLLLMRWDATRLKAEMSLRKRGFVISERGRE